MVFFLALVSGGQAASVRQVSMAEMLQNSELVFQGEVLSLESVETGPKQIHTYVTFRIEDIVKGQYPQGIITLRYLGGTVNNRTLAVSDMILPRPGEHGIYFVESLERRQMHPLYGWSQGHFLVQPDDTGVGLVTTRRGDPVTGINPGVSLAPENDIQAAGPFFDPGVVRGVELQMKENGPKPLTAEEFKKQLREMLEKINE